MAEGPEDSFGERRQQMVDQCLLARGITDERVLRAFLELPREEFVGPEYRERAYEDRPLPIGDGQTISQPYIVAYMLQALVLRETDVVLEVGTGSGYVAALLSRLVHTVVSMEVRPDLEAQALTLLKRLHYSNVELVLGDGNNGYPQRAPYDAIIVSAAPAEIPRALLQQLRPGGRMVLPFGVDDQELLLLRKGTEGLEATELGGVRFVPLISGTP